MLDNIGDLGHNTEQLYANSGENVVDVGATGKVIDSVFVSDAGMEKECGEVSAETTMCNDKNVHLNSIIVSLKASLENNNVLGSMDHAFDDDDKTVQGNDIGHNSDNSSEAGSHANDENYIVHEEENLKENAEDAWNDEMNLKGTMDTDDIVDIGENSTDLNQTMDTDDTELYNQKGVSTNESEINDETSSIDEDLNNNVCKENLHQTGSVFNINVITIKGDTTE